LRPLPLQPGDVGGTHADPSLLMALTDYRRATSLETGVEKFAQWHRIWAPKNTGKV
jgi:UDP-glucuronate 4-epimerase